MLQLLCDGLSTRQAARRLACSPRTVEKHLQHVYRKLEVRDRVNAMRVARLAGVVVELPTALRRHDRHPTRRPRRRRRYRSDSAAIARSGRADGTSAARVRAVSNRTQVGPARSARPPAAPRSGAAGHRPPDPAADLHRVRPPRCPRSPGRHPGPERPTRILVAGGQVAATGGRRQRCPQTRPAVGRECRTASATIAQPANGVTGASVPKATATPARSRRPTGSSPRPSTPSRCSYSSPDRPRPHRTPVGHCPHPQPGENRRSAPASPSRRAPAGAALLGRPPTPSSAAPAGDRSRRRSRRRRRCSGSRRTVRLACTPQVLGDLLDAQVAHTASALPGASAYGSRQPRRP